MITKDILPIGSVVKLDGINHLVMIYGRNVVQSTTGKQYDYVGCPYPQGFINNAYNIFFNKDAIETLVFKGYENQEERILRTSL